MTVALMLALATERVATAQPAPTGSFTREAMLRDTVRNCIVPAYQQLASRCRDLTNAIGALANAPSQSTFDDARSAWVAASLAASRVRCVQVGPMAAPGGYGAAFYFWQEMPNSIEGKIASTRAIDSSFVDEMGATTKGMYALEYLLYGAKGGPNAPPGKISPPLELLSASAAQRRRDYLVILARDLETKAGELEKAWSDPGTQGVAAKFVDGGQQSLNQLVNVMAVALEDVSDRHLHLALILPQPVAGQLYRIERSPSGTSVQSLAAILESAQKIYRNSNGLSLIDAVKQINLPTATVLEQRFEDALAATRAIGPPLDQAIVDSRPAVENAFDKTHTLEVKFKVDLASTLGVTLTFSSADGD
jgi:predicted lipoprotein